MKDLFISIGAITVVACLLVVVAAAYSVINWHRQNWALKQQHIASHEIGNVILQFSWWCHDVGSQAALVAVGQQLVRHGGMGDYGQLRERIEQMIADPNQMKGAR